MTQKREYVIERNRQIADGVWRMQLSGCTQGFTPGRFVNILVPGFTLRRPLAICDYDTESFSVCYKLVGGGTRELSAQKAGTKLDILAPLGNGFELVNNNTTLLVGGGAGVAPLLCLAKQLKQNDCAVRVALGFNTSREIYLEKELSENADCVEIATIDGSVGTKGLVSCLLEELGKGADAFYTCGPIPMMKAVCEHLPDMQGWVSLEERMACGFGGCVGCAIPTRSGMRRVCADGPVFAKEEMLWQ